MNQSSGKPEEILTPGTRVSHYEILNEIGHGGAGVVYLCRDLHLDREVALKCVRPDHSWDADSHRHLLREARTASRLSHPNIVRIFEVFEQAGTPWIAMEAVRGSSLGKILAKQGSLPLDQILGHAEDLAEALRVAHARGIVHHDVSPNNILITNEGRAVLTDFGLASFHVPPDQISEVSTRGLSFEQSKLIGTPGYMSPEQLLGRSVDKRTDIFALGAVLYRMCAGEPAFNFTGHGDMIDAVLHRDPVALTHLVRHIPVELDRIVSKALAKRPAERYQDAGELLADLRALRRRLQSADSTVERRNDRQPRTHRRRALLVLGAVALVTAAGIPLSWLRVREQQDELTKSVPRPLTVGEAWEAEPAVSPDGAFVAYASSEGDPNGDIWMIDVQGGGRLRLTEDPAADRSPSWFPDGTALAFVSDRGGAPSIWKVPRLGGSAVLIVPDGRDPAISFDGRQIAFSRANAMGDPRIHVAPLSDPKRATLLTGDGDGLWEHTRPSWSHDGRALCYQDFRNLWVVPVDGGKARAVTADPSSNWNPVWSADDRHIIFSSDRGGARALWRVAVAGGTPERVTTGAGLEGQPSVSRNGRLIGYSTFAETLGIVILDRRTGSRAVIKDQTPGTPPVFLPDRSATIFASSQSGRHELWEQPLAGGAPAGRLRRLTEQAGSFGSLTVSPDGRWIAYHRILGTERDIWILPAQGGPPENFTDDPAVDIQPAWSPDGSRIAFVSDRGGHEQIWIAPVAEGRAAGAAFRITAGETREAAPAWSPDGRNVAFIRFEANEADAWIAPADASTPPRQVTSHAAADTVAWEPSGDSLLVSGLWGSRRLGLRRVSLAGGDPQPVPYDVDFGWHIGSFSMSADGRFLAYVEASTRGDIWVLEPESGSL